MKYMDNYNKKYIMYKNLKHLENNINYNKMKNELSKLYQEIELEKKKKNDLYKNYG